MEIIAATMVLFKKYLFMHSSIPLLFQIRTLDPDFSS